MPARPAPTPRTRQGIVPAGNIQSVNAATAPSTGAVQPGIPNANGGTNAPTTGTATPPAASTTVSATSIIADVVNSIPGLTAIDPNGVFAQWITGQVNAMNQTNTSSSDMLSTLTATINNPAASGDAQAQAVFDQLFPGYQQRIQTMGNNGGGLSAYISYASQITSIANGVGLLPGTVTPAIIGNAWGNDVSANEFTDRLTTGYAAAYDAAQNIPGFSDFMLKNYGVTTAGLASYYLNPDNAKNVLQNNYNSGITGAAAQQVGLGELSQAQAAEVGHFLSTTAGGGIGGVGQVSEGQAANALTGNLAGTGANAVQLAQGYQHGPAEQQVSTDTALQAVTGNQQAGAQVALAVGSRTAAAKGGGGTSQNASGATGLGFAQE